MTELIAALWEKKKPFLQEKNISYQIQMRWDVLVGDTTTLLKMKVEDTNASPTRTWTFVIKTCLTPKKLQLSFFHYILNFTEGMPSEWTKGFSPALLLLLFPTQLEMPLPDAYCTSLKLCNLSSVSLN